jgi:glycerophosphoryl diester phosphodiesterase
MKYLWMLLLGSCQVHYHSKLTNDDKNFIHELSQGHKTHVWKVDNYDFVVVAESKDSLYLYTVELGIIKSYGKQKISTDSTGRVRSIHAR